MKRLWDGLANNNSGEKNEPLKENSCDIEDCKNKTTQEIKRRVKHYTEKVDRAYEQTVYNRRDILLIHRLIVKLVEEGVVSKKCIIGMKEQVTEDMKEEYPDMF